ncbi:hypothetical protein ACSBR1_019759 [Camellia fascicularis]
MGKRIQSLTISFLLIISLILGSGILTTEARPLNGLGQGSSREGESFFSALPLAVAVMKNAGPSSGDGNRRYEDLQTLGGIKNSGPSPGEGHGYVHGNHL